MRIDLSLQLANVMLSVCMRMETDALKSLVAKKER